MQAGARAQSCVNAWQPGPNSSLAGVGGDIFACTIWDPDEDGPETARIVVGGQFGVAGTISAANIAAWDGARWLAFGQGLQGEARALAVIDLDGAGGAPARLVAAGRRTQGSGLHHVLAWDGDAWQPLGGEVMGSVEALVVWDVDGPGPGAARLVAAGDFTAIGTVAASRIAAWDGSSWQPLGDGFDNTVYALAALDPDGDGPAVPELFAGGSFLASGAMQLSRAARWDGAQWVPLGLDMDNEVRSLTVWDRDDCGPLPPQLVAGGLFTFSNRPANDRPLRVAAWSGSRWERLWVGMDLSVEALATWDPDGPGPAETELVAGGAFNTASSVSAPRIARYDPSPNGSGGFGRWFPFSTGMDDSVEAIVSWDIDAQGPRPALLVAVGRFAVAGDFAASHVASWDGTRWLPLGAGVSSSVLALETLDTDLEGPALPGLIAAGEFTHVGALRVNNIASWDGAEWSPLGSGLDAPAGTLIAWNDPPPEFAHPVLIAGGSFASAGGVPASRVALWDTQQWHALGGGLDAAVHDLETWDRDGAGPERSTLVVGGSFLSAGGVPALRLALWDGSTWSPLGGGFDDAVLALTTAAPPGNGPEPHALIAGGRFRTSQGVTLNYVARWDETAASWQPLAQGMDNWVYTLTTWDRDAAGFFGDEIIAGGIFSFAGRPDANDRPLRVARWNGVRWERLFVGMDRAVRALTTWDPDNAGPVAQEIIAGGEFSTASSQPVSNIARWDPFANSPYGRWQPMGKGVDATVEALVQWDPDGPGAQAPALVVGGRFSTADGRIAPFITQFGRGTTIWRSAASGMLDDPARWLCGVSPSPIDTVYVDAPAVPYSPFAFTIALPAQPAGEPVSLRALRIRTDAVRLNLGARGLILTETRGLTEPGIIVGGRAGQPASLIVSSDGPAPVELASESLILGPDETEFPLLRELRLDSPAASLHISGDAQVGVRGNASELAVLEGALARVEGELALGVEPGSQGGIVIAGAPSLLLHSGPGASFSIGSRGAGSLLIGGPGLHGASAATIDRMGSLTLGVQPGSSAFVLLSGAGSTWDVRANQITLGRAGATLMQIEDGAQFITDTLQPVSVGQFAESAARVEITAGSAWSERTSGISVGPAATILIDGTSRLEAPLVNVLASATLEGSGVVAGPEGAALTLINVGTIAPGLAADQAAQAAPLVIDGDLLMCDVDCLPTGACCVPGGGCLDTTGAQCFALGGTFYPELACSACPCGTPGLTSPDSGALELDLFAPDSADSLIVTGAATLAGSLVVSRAEGFTDFFAGPATLLSAGAISGFFDVAFLPAAGDPAFYLRACRVNQSGDCDAQGNSVALIAEPLAALIQPQPRSDSELAGTPAAAAKGDFDGVNGVDVAVAVPDPTDPTLAPGDLIILFNEGVSTDPQTGQPVWNGFSVREYKGVLGRDPAGIAVGQFDANAGLDIVVCEAADDTVSVLLNDGEGNFSARRSFSVGDEPRAVAAEDLDGDGVADVATANASAGTVTLLRNQGPAGPGGQLWPGLGQTPGDQRLDLLTDPASADPRPVALIARPLNAAPGAEIAVVNHNSSRLTIFANAAAAAWGDRWSGTPLITQTVENPDTVDSDNLDDDKWEDIVATSGTVGVIGISLNSHDDMEQPGALGFRPAVAVPAGIEPSSIASADLDADGDRDLAVTTTSETTGQRIVRLFRNDAPTDGTLTISLDRDIASDSNPVLVLSGDLDDDSPNGPDDLIVISGDPGNLLRAAGTDFNEARLAARVPFGPELRARGMNVPSRIKPVLASVPCRGDANFDRAVDFQDVIEVLRRWATDYSTPNGLGDTDGSGLVDFADIILVLRHWGSQCG
ncbi:MAG: FG-GAP-like repeat-containing protein [Planctomycetota bacterium]|nr:FG-GAP-like repeat-containing protein [Planctomycetota bacterium]